MKQTDTRAAQLEQRIERLNEQEADLKAEVAEKQRFLNRVQNHRDGLAEQLNELRAAQGAAGLHLTAHAIYRWLERVHGVPVSDAIKELETFATSARFHGDGRYPIPGTGARAVVRDGTIVTVTV